MNSRERTVTFWKDSFLSAFPFLTVIRSNRSDNRPYNMVSSIYTFSLVGLLIGAGLAGVKLLSGTIAPVIMVGYLAVITGFLHLDGLADTFDGLFSHRSREEMLSIMRDSRIGTMGACGVGLCILAKYQAFTQLESLLCLIAIPALARFGMAIVLVCMPYARPAGLAEDFIQAPEPALLLQLIPVEIFLFMALGFTGLVQINLIFALTVGLLMLWYHRKIGGITGDMTGAVCEISEAVLFLAAVSLLP